MRIIKGALLAFVAIALLGFPVAAALRISPDIIDAEVKQGDNQLPSVYVGNESSSPQDFAVILLGFGQAIEGNTVVLEKRYESAFCCSLHQIHA